MSKENSGFVIKSQYSHYRGSTYTSSVVRRIVLPEIFPVDQVQYDSFGDLLEETYQCITQSFSGTYNLESLLMDGVPIRIYSDNWEFKRFLTLDELHATH
jgi:hypothetical protein